MSQNPEEIKEKEIEEKIVVETTPANKVSEVVIGDEVLKVNTVIDAPSPSPSPSPSFVKDFKFGKKSDKNFKSRSRSARPVREKPEFDSKTVDVRRVTRVVAGGRRFSLSVAAALGDKNGRVGFGLGKALDTQAAIEKSHRAAKKNMLTLKLTKNKSIPYDVTVKYKSARLWMTPNKGKGLIAGSSARTILALAGVNNVTAKFRSGTKNKINNAKAAMKALSLFTK